MNKLTHITYNKFINEKQQNKLAFTSKKYILARAQYRNIYLFKSTQIILSKNLDIDDYLKYLSKYKFLCHKARNKIKSRLSNDIVEWLEESRYYE